LEKNKLKWENEVKIIAINSDLNKVYTKNLISSLNISLIDHLYIDCEKEKDHPLLNVTKKLGFPLCIFINNDNVIEFVGSLFEIDIYTKINTILNRSLVTATNYFPQNNLKKEEIISLKDCIKIFKERLLYLKSSINVPHLCGGNLIMKTIYTAGDIANKHVLAYLNYYCHISDENYLYDMFNNIENLSSIEVEKNYVETINLFYGDFCDRCDIEIDIEEGEYFCNECNCHLCKQCGEDITSLQNLEECHEHFLYFFSIKNKDFMNLVLKYNTDNCYDFDFKYFNEHKKLKEYIKNIQTHYQVKCEGCLSFPIKNVRWKCTNCIFKNMCDSCRNYIENKIQPFYDEILFNMQHNDCKPNEHIFMKIIFDDFVF
jgi:hypothetical protein